MTVAINPAWLQQLHGVVSDLNPALGEFKLLIVIHPKGDTPTTMYMGTDWEPATELIETLHAVIAMQVDETVSNAPTTREIQ